MAATEEDRWTHHVCPDCGAWIRLYGAIKYQMGKCTNQKCESANTLDRLESFPTKIQYMKQHAERGGCPVCDKPIKILPGGRGTGTTSYRIMGHALVHNECVGTYKAMMDYEETIK